MISDISASGSRVFAKGGQNATTQLDGEVETGELAHALDAHEPRVSECGRRHQIELAALRLRRP